MNEKQKPLLLFPLPSASEREKRSPSFSKVHFPAQQRQGERLNPKFNALQAAFRAGRIQLQTSAPTEDPERIVVFETIGSIEKFLGAVKGVPGLEWLLESDEINVEPDEDFFDKEDREKPLSGRLFLLGTTLQALNEVINLWHRYQNDNAVKFARGLGMWKEVFKHLRDIRFWGVQDRVGQDVLQYWRDRITCGDTTIRFEIETWCYSAADKNHRAAQEIKLLIEAQGGRVLQSALIAEIAYHGFLIELPVDGVRSLIDHVPTMLIQSEQVMFFRPHGQTLIQPVDGTERMPATVPSQRTVAGLPKVALLDGLPLQNHPLLAGRLMVDDPDGWEETYQAMDRNHGTGMASLILYGELDGPRVPLQSPVYVRPIMRPDAKDFRSPRQESTPDNLLLIDLVHRAVKRIFEGENGSPPAAPSIKVINLSIGDSYRPFDLELSPWARLLDWLSFKYKVLFIVSAGNIPAALTLALPQHTLSETSSQDRTRLAMVALVSETVSRRMMAPAESINAMTVGAVHADQSTFVNVSDRFDIFPFNGVSPYSCIGHGFRRAVKPDIVLPGGRALYRERPNGLSETTQLELLNTSAGPGHRVAAPPDPSGNNTRYTRGTSNATALATRGAAIAHSIIEELRAGNPLSLPERYDAVLLKAMLTHGAEWGDLENQILEARPDIVDWRKQKNLVARCIGYGLADIDRAITCTEQRATLLGVGELKDGQALEFKVPLPPSLSGKVVKRRLTLTLAWLTPSSSRHAKYRAARLWIKPPHDSLRVARQNCEWNQVQRGTVQHEILEGQDAIAFIDGNALIFKVNCAEDGGKLLSAVPFALCVTLEVGEGIDLPIYQEIQARVGVRVGVQT